MLLTTTIRRVPRLFLRRIQTKTPTPIATDAQGIPLKPTWSIHELISSYPKPTLSDEEYARLHRLSELLPPETSTESTRKKVELEELIRLVEAVRLVDTNGVVYEPFTPEMEFGSETENKNKEEAKEEDKVGRDLLEYAEKTQDGFYVVHRAR